METIQLAVADGPYARALRELLTRQGTWEVVCVDSPDPLRDGVVVMDEDALGRAPLPLPNPGRVVLIARNESGPLSRAWDAGVTSVVFEKDPLGTVVLAIMAARLAKPRPATAANGGTP